jgi:hypothetical protein
MQPEPYMFQQNQQIRIVKDELHRSHPLPVLHPVPTPVFNKASCKRELIDIPVSQISLAALLLLYFVIVMLL